MRSLVPTTLLLSLALSAGCDNSEQWGLGGPADDCDEPGCSDFTAENVDVDDLGGGGSGDAGDWQPSHDPSSVQLDDVAHVKIIGEGSYDYSGVAVAPAGDVNGDGFDDVVVGSYRTDTAGTDSGAAYIVYGPVTDDVPLAGVYQSGDGIYGARILGESALDYAGAAVVGAGDVDGDGYDDVVIGAYGNDGAGSETGAVYLIRGPAEGDILLEDADAKLTGVTIGDLAGIDIAAAGDVDDDGFADLLVGALMEGDDGGEPVAGATYLIRGPFEGELSLATATARIYAAGEDVGRAGQAVAGVGDIDGDGLPDIVSGDYLDETSGGSTGAARLFLSPVVGDLWTTDSDGVVVGTTPGDNVGISLAGAGDIDDDGHADVLVGAQGDDVGASNAGAFYLVLGPDWGDRTTADVAAQVYSTDSGVRFGNDLAGPGDVDGDGFDDIVVGSRYEDEGATDAGAAWLFYGSLSGSHSAASIGTRISGESAGDRAGWSVAGAGDMDADGLPDLLVGAFGQDAAGYDSGASYIVIGLGGPQ